MNIADLTPNYPTQIAKYRFINSGSFSTICNPLRKQWHKISIILAAEVSILDFQLAFHNATETDCERE